MSDICLLISKRRMAINGLWSCPQSMDYIGKIIVDVCFLKRKESEKIMKNRCKNIVKNAGKCVF